ncbi:COQ9 family protein [Sphingomonas sp. M1-B02]|uniref:COQ9 family protein n=1 Tax=Sphingomonas sp. M1-B02 TaxID=3114300 RepID=UPI00223ECC2F|nr:COQ9 family protein [Sphingomonas sp. S6-11]UZK65286.1 COQ9 family protein [Sphingomonas sp. S6-11]
MDLADATLDELRAALAPIVAANAAFDGWNVRALDAAADSLGVDRDVAHVTFPGGAVEMIDAWFASVDAEMATRLPPEMLAAMKIRARITALVEARLDILAPHRDALRRAVSILAMPQNALRAARLGWRSADAMWRLAGDTATDYNHYTKRGLLGTVYAATIAVFLQDESDAHADTRAFLARRIENIMQFEKAKAGFLSRTEHRPSLSRFIGRLRYPVV